MELFHWGAVCCVCLFALQGSLRLSKLPQTNTSPPSPRIISFASQLTFACFDYSLQLSELFPPLLQDFNCPHILLLTVITTNKHHPTNRICRQTFMQVRSKRSGSAFSCLALKHIQYSCRVVWIRFEPIWCHTARHTCRSLLAVKLLKNHSYTTGFIARQPVHSAH